jgi:hypothetical protein
MLATVQLSNRTKPTPLRMETTPPLPSACARIQKVRRLDDRTHCKRMRKRRREERTVMSATAQATNATETLPPTMDTTPEPCVRPNGRAAAAIAAA